MNKIEKLTPEQEAQLDVYAKKWTENGLKTGLLTADERTKAEELLLAIYAQEGLAAPKITWAMSPKEGADIAAQLSSRGSSVVYDCFYGQHDSSWLSSLDFYRNELGLVEETEGVKHHIELSKLTGWIYVYDTDAIICEKPTSISTNEEGDLHSTEGPAIEYADGFKLFMLNGVEVTQEIIERKEWTKEQILGEVNADIRREIIRLLGNEKTFEILGGTVVDEKFGYELLMIDYGDKTNRPHLKMINPSMGTVHIEGVEPGCKTVEDAIKFRNSLEEFSLPMLLDGKEMFSKFQGTYFQQGDALFFPTLDPVPEGLTAKADMIAVHGLRRHKASGKGVTVYDGFLTAPEGAVIRHEQDHHDLPLPGGNYRVKQVMEYDHALEEARAVVD